MNTDRPSRPSSAADKRQPALLALFLALACLAIALTGVAAGDSTDRGRDAASARAAGVVDTAPWGERFARQAEARAERLEEQQLTRDLQLRSPEARSQRERSGDLFGDLAKPEAVALGRQTFKEVLAADVSPGLGLRKGDRVVAYVGDRGARVVSENGRSAFVEATLPLRTADETGQKRPVELALDDRGEFLESDNPLVDARYSKDPAQGAVLRSSGVGVALVGTRPDAAGQEEGDRLVVAEALSDTDLWTSPTASGFRTHAVLRSEQSPEELSFDVSLPAGSELRPTVGGAAEVARDDDRLVSISAPVAWDADGRDVPVEMTVDGDRLVLSVPHRDRDVRYPLLVDPSYEEWDWLEDSDLNNPHVWQGFSNTSGTFDSAYLELPYRWGRACTSSHATVRTCRRVIGPAGCSTRRAARPTSTAAWSRPARTGRAPACCAASTAVRRPATARPRSTTTCRASAA